MIFKKLFFVAFVCIFALSNLFAQSANFWQKKDASMFRAERSWLPAHYETYQLDLSGLKQQLSAAPVVNLALWHGENEGVKIALPMPDGSFEDFILAESPMMEPELAAQLPDIKTYAGYSLTDKTAYMRCSFTVWGFHGYILSEKGTVYIDPFSGQTTETYISYLKKDVPHRATAMRCLQQGTTTLTRLFLLTNCQV